MEMEIVVAVLSVLVPTLSSIAYLGYWLGRKFGKIDERFKNIEERFRGVEERFREMEKNMDERFEEMNKRFEERFKQVNKRFEEVERRLDGLKGYVDEKFGELREYIDYRIERLGRAFSSYQEFFVEYLSAKGVVSSDEATMLKNEATRLSLLALTNPFTKEEWEKLKRYLDKDPKDFTLKEAEEFRELGRKAIAEYWDRPEAYKLHLYTCVVYGLALRKLKEEREKRAEARQAS
jgi:DNA anti-recombination protein RmuC